MAVSTFGEFKQTERGLGLNTVDTGSGFSGTSLIPALTGLIGLSGRISEIKAKGAATRADIISRGKSLKFSQYQKKQELEDLNRVVGDKLSESGLEALKAEARLKAAAAETGASGTSINDAIATADVNRLHRDAAILRSYDVTKAGKLNDLVAERLSFENITASIAGGLPASSTTNFVSALNTFSSGAMAGLNMLSQSQKEEFFGINITGEG